ncbi:Putative xyloglucan endotransglucosylase/hydrolase protein 1 [Linum perenne]
MKIKSSSKDTSCIITSFYVISAYDPHDEIDFEFYGSKSHPYELQTNVFANGLGCREQKVALWFDPTADFHTYEILWNQNQIVFSVDTIPIRVFKNNTGLGVDYPWRPMQVQATIWEADWACKKGKPDLSQGRFVASYQNFGIAGCPTYDENDPNSRAQCYSPNLWWNSPNYCYLSPNENQNYKNIRDRHLTYDYCLDKLRYPVPPPECQANLPY